MYRNDPYFLKARFASVCPETGKTINKGDKCAYYPRERKAFHVDSKAAEDLRALLFANCCGMADANW